MIFPRLRCAALLTAVMCAAVDADQTVLGSAGSWRADLSTDWDVLGPFPIHAREQHFLSPSFPLNLSEPIDKHRSWPSSYADGGQVRWSTAKSDEKGDLSISFPDTRWSKLRGTEGWAALQHHAVLRTTLTIYPSESAHREQEEPRLLVNLIQGSFFCVIPAESHDSSTAETRNPQWYAGNIYNVTDALPRAVGLPSGPSRTAPTQYHIFVSGDYEIRLFGDPRSAGSEIPVQRLHIAVELEQPARTVRHVPSHDVTCDFVEGRAFGDAAGIGLRSVGGWWTVKHAALAVPIDGLEIDLVREVVLAPTQTRIAPLRIIQTRPISATHTKLTVALVLSTAQHEDSGASAISLSVVLRVAHHEIWAAADTEPIKASFFFAESIPSAFLCVPPREPNDGEPRPPIVALHGAGVDIFSMPEWAASLPRQARSWILVATGRTPWGFDWHGPSTQDTWASLAALTKILVGESSWSAWTLKRDTKVVLMGHSNGGQGTWYVAARYPDRVLAAVPAAGYIKSQAYVPLTQSRSSHFVDPAARAILETSLTPDDNDLFMSNLAHIPIMAIHGDEGDDDNVPTWHSRELVGILKSWNAENNVSYREDEGQPHWYKNALNNDEVQSFLDSTLSQDSRAEIGSINPFTLTVSISAESGSLYGWTIESLTIPGRLARLRVEQRNGTTYVRTINVHRFSLRSGVAPLLFNVDGVPVQSRVDHPVPLVFEKAREKDEWTLAEHSAGINVLQPSGRLAAILTSAAPLTLVVPDDPPHEIMSVALRIAHDLDLHHRLDVEIVNGPEMLRRLETGTIGKGNILIVGRLADTFVRKCLDESKTPFFVRESSIGVHGKVFDGTSLAALFLHPHPDNPSGKMLFLLGTDTASLERAARLFPIRTGVTVPDWILVGEEADSIGTGGVVGGGVWADGWSWNEVMSFTF